MQPHWPFVHSNNGSKKLILAINFMYSYLESVFCPLFILVVTPIDKGGSNMWTRRLTSPLPHPHTPHPLIQPIAAVGPIEQPRTINRHVPVYIIATRLHAYILEQQIYLFIEE